MIDIKLDDLSIINHRNSIGYIHYSREYIITYNLEYLFIYLTSKNIMISRIEYINNSIYRTRVELDIPLSMLANGMIKIE